MGFWDFGNFYFSLNSANEGVKGTVSRSRRVSPGSWVQMQQRCWATISRKRPFWDIRMRMTVWNVRSPIIWEESELSELGIPRSHGACFRWTIKAGVQKSIKRIAGTRWLRRQNLIPNSGIRFYLQGKHAVCKRERTLLAGSRIKAATGKGVQALGNEGGAFSLFIFSFA